MSKAAIVLAGGRSRRMGSAKAALEWHGSTLLRHITGIAGRGVDGPVVVVRAAGQALPRLAPGVDVVEDLKEGLGPMQGLAMGLARAQEVGADVAFACSTDMPFLHVAFVRRVVEALGDADVAVPIVGGHRQPMAAAYRSTLAPTAQALVDEGRLRPAFLFDDRPVVWLDDATLLADPRLRAFDPDLASVQNVNDPDAYATARTTPAPSVSVRVYGVLAVACPAGTAPMDVRAATVGMAAAAVGVALDDHVVAAINGDHLTRDGHEPLCTGDDVALLSADAGG